jgi:hypothetical protein
MFIYNILYIYMHECVIYTQLPLYIERMEGKEKEEREGRNSFSSILFEFFAGTDHCKKKKINRRKTDRRSLACVLVFHCCDKIPERMTYFGHGFRDVDIGSGLMLNIMVGSTRSSKTPQPKMQREREREKERKSKRERERERERE